MCTPSPPYRANFNALWRLDSMLSCAEHQPTPFACAKCRASRVCSVTGSLEVYLLTYVHAPKQATMELHPQLCWSCARIRCFRRSNKGRALLRYRAAITENRRLLLFTMVHIIQACRQTLRVFISIQPAVTMSSNAVVLSSCRV